jgi:hypothetical protein
VNISLSRGQPGLETIEGTATRWIPVSDGDSSGSAEEGDIKDSSSGGPVVAVNFHEGQQVGRAAENPTGSGCGCPDAEAKDGMAGGVENG